jgi:hypothetical protein
LEEANAILSNKLEGIIINAMKLQFTNYEKVIRNDFYLYRNPRNNEERVTDFDSSSSKRSRKSSFAEFTNELRQKVNCCANNGRWGINLLSGSTRNRLPR